MKNLKSLSAIVVIAMAATGCAGTGANYVPTVDGPVSSRWSADLAQCQQLARRHGFANAQTRNAALVGAGIGAVAGLADDDVTDTEGAVGGAVVGALVGGGAGMAARQGERRGIVISCMRGRGHRVVG